MFRALEHAQTNQKQAASTASIPNGVPSAATAEQAFALSKDHIAAGRAYWVLVQL